MTKPTATVYPPVSVLHGGPSPHPAQSCPDPWLCQNEGWSRD